MKKFIIFILICISSQSFSKSVSCKFNSDETNGDIHIVSKGKYSNLTLKYLNKTHNYKKCKTDKDDFGLLIDCSEMNLDFMVLINENSGSNSGGIMSSTFDLFVDLDC